MQLKIVERKSVQGKPTWYLYDGSKYLGTLFLTPETAFGIGELLNCGSEYTRQHIGDTIEVKWVDGPMFEQSSNSG